MGVSILEDASTWRHSTAGAGSNERVPYRILSRSGNYSEDNSSIQEEYIIEANRLEDFIEESFPLGIITSGTMFLPRRRAAPGNIPLVTTSVDWEAWVDGKPIDPFSSDPLSSDSDDKTYGGFIKVTITYSTTPMNDEDQDENDPLTFLTVTANTSGQFLAPPLRGDAIWTGLGAEQDEEVREADVPNVIIAPETEWSVKWGQIPFNFFNDTLMSRLRDRIGTINDAAMTVFFGAPTETVLFIGFSISQQFTWRAGSAGQPPMQLDMRFLEKNLLSDEDVQVTHNHFYRPGKGWRKIQINGVDPFKSTDLSAIFSPAPLSAIA